MITYKGKNPREENGNPLQHSSLGNPVDRGAWRTIVHGVSKRRTCLSTNTFVKEKNLEKIYIIWITLLYTWNQYNIMNQLDTKKKFLSLVLNPGSIINQHVTLGELLNLLQPWSVDRDDDITYLIRWFSGSNKMYLRYKAQTGYKPSLFKGLT